MNELLQKLLSNPASLLVGGGVITAMVAGWSQVKGFLAQLLAVLVVRGNFNGPGAYYLGELLARDWFLLPSAQLKFWSERRPTRDFKEAIVVWRIFAGSGLFFNGWRFLFVTTLGGHEASVWTLRGVVDLDKLAITCSQHGTSELSSMDERLRRFFKRVMIGQQKIGSKNFDPTVVSQVSKAQHPDSAGDAANTPHTDSGTIAIWQKMRPPLSMTSAELEIPRSQGLDGFFYDQPIMDEISDIERWLQMQTWFQDRHLPWTRGWLLWGPPGTGKSSLAEVTAKHLGVPLYIFKLGTVSDQELTEMWGELATPCLCLFEDFDAVFDGRKPLTEHKTLTFDCILNLLSGPQQRDGVFLVVTTNHVDKIDAALGLPAPGSESGESTRPGRIDRVIHVGAASEGQRRYIVNKILRDFDHETRDRMAAGLSEGSSVAQVQERCITFIMDALKTGVYPHGKNPLKTNGVVTIT